MLIELTAQLLDCRTRLRQKGVEWVILVSVDLPKKNKIDESSFKQIVYII